MPLPARPCGRRAVDYAHGTGHGVGAFLAVHEGPQRIAKPGGGQMGTDEPLRAGMFLSNEPGYYKPGAYGIRIENLVLVEPREIADAEGDYLGFETLTFAPIDKTLIDRQSARTTQKSTGSTPITRACSKSSARSLRVRRRPG